MNIKLVGLSDEVLNLLNESKRVLDISFAEEGQVINVTKLEGDAETCIEVSNGEIKYKEMNHLFRALGLYIQFSNKGGVFHRVEKCEFETIGGMIDASRNAVYRVEQVKDMLANMAVMGLNRCMLYTEDTYEIEGYKYFGYLRGRYSKEELKEIDDYGYSLGIEIVPCIQTLAHLKQTLKWDYANGMRDTADVLLVGEEKTYEFVDSMISSLRGVFRSKNIHVGMDEAFDLGRGEYLTKNGQKSHQELMIKHLKRVCEITKKYDFKPMMWDDMFLRAGAPNGGYYDVNAVITKDITDNIPEEVSLVYWDYYTGEEEKYAKLFEIRESFNNPVIFAGGTWRWLGFSPSYSRTIITTNAALNQCKSRGIKEVFATAWGDDGSEAPINSIMLGLILFAEHAYNKEFSNEWLNERCEFQTGLTMDDFCCLEELDIVPTVKNPNILSMNPSKYLMYQDLLLGAFDKHIVGIDLKGHYDALTEKYGKIAEKTDKYKSMFKMYSCLSDFLSVKGDLGLRITEAYLKRDLEELKNIVHNVLPDLQKKLQVFHNSFRNLWYKECKGHGFEVIDIRVGGVQERIKSTEYRLNMYLNGEIDSIEELEEERLFFLENTEEECRLISFNQYQRIATQNTLSW